MRLKLVLVALLSVLCLVLLGLFAQKSEARLSSNNRRAVVLEAFYALHPGYSGWSDKWIGHNCVSNWNYLANDYNAYNIMKSWYGCSSSVWAVPADGNGCGVAPASFYTNPWAYGYGTFNGWQGSVGRGGQCKYFVDLILYRSESQVRIGGTHTLPNYATMWGNTESNLATAKEGDVILFYDGPGGATDHVAIVVEVKRSGGTVTGLDVVDSNFVSDLGFTGNREVIGRHLYQIPNIQGKFKIWKGTTYYHEPYVP